MMMQMFGPFLEFESAMEAYKGVSGFCSPGRTHRRTTSNADAPTTVEIGKAEGRLPARASSK
jgi:hypothetical protein